MHISKIAMIDSGISQYSKGYNSTAKQYCIKETEDGIRIEEDIAHDENGHGTVISDIIYQQNPNVELYIFKIVSEQSDIDCEQLCIVLEYILRNVDVDLINISAGITYIDYYTRMERVCNQLKEKGIILLSAFDNNGAISYPAAIPSVLGVDTIDGGLKKDDIVWVENSCVNFIMPAKFYRTVWNDGTKTIMKGTSFACAELTGKISKSLFDEQGNKRSLLEVISDFITCRSVYKPFNKVEGPQFKIEKAILFPVNKEAHALLRFQDMLEFDIVGLFDERVSGLVGKEMFGKKVESYHNIDWEGDFDTIVVSCVSKLSSLTRKNYSEEIIEKARIHKKNVYTFERIQSDYENVFYPEIVSENVPRGNMQKLRKILMPLVGVFGTSSKQGKYSLQLALKKRLEQKGYKTGLLATEPSGYLFGADSVFHFGYESDIQLNQEEYVCLLNELIWNMDKKGYDIGITGCQSGTIPYDYSNIRTFTLPQQNFLFGTRPDFYILCVNPHDDIAYVQRTIQYINAIDVGKVGACALFPVRSIIAQVGMHIKKEQLKKEELVKCKEFFSTHCGLPVYEIGNDEDMEQLTKLIIHTFNGEDES